MRRPRPSDGPIGGARLEIDHVLSASQLGPAVARTLDEREGRDRYIDGPTA